MRVWLFLLFGCLLTLTACSSSSVQTMVTETPVRTLPPPPVSPAVLPAPPVTPDNLPEERVIAQSIAVPAAKPDPPFVEPRPADPRLLNALRRLSTVQFAFDSAGLSDAAQSVITANARILRDFPSHPVVLEGRADERGTVAYNLVLGERRAMRVRRYLQDIGIFDWRLSVISYGVDRPLCREHAEICWQVNRSVRFVIEDAPLF